CALPAMEPGGGVAAIAGSALFGGDGADDGGVDGGGVDGGGVDDGGVDDGGVLDGGADGSPVAVPAVRSPLPVPTALGSASSADRLDENPPPELFFAGALGVSSVSSELPPSDLQAANTTTLSTTARLNRIIAP
nr:hypothetical protein [Deltaproteobacteria bacterium]